MATENATPTCRLVQAGAPFEGKQGLTYAVGISAESVWNGGMAAARAIQKRASAGMGMRRNSG